MLRVKIGKNDVGKRADIFVASKYPQFTRSSLIALFTKDMVKINNKSAKAASKLHKDDKVEVDESLLNSHPPEIELPVIYEDEDVIVINKPTGVLTHSKGTINTEATVASWLIDHLKKANYDIKSLFARTVFANRMGIVHRLDRATSGVIICAKNEHVLKWLQKQFSTRKVKKVYIAIVEGIPSPQEAIIDAPIERNPKKPQVFRVGVGGRPAQTKYKVIKTFKKKDRSYTLLELNPQTGRTHQLRVHLKYIGHPIVGDQVYGHGAEIMYLHAKSLEIILPDGQPKKFEIPEPKVFKDFIK